MLRTKALTVLLLWMVSCIAAMADTLTIPNTFVANTLIRASEVNQNNTAITTWANGNITNTNVKAGADISPTKLDLTAEFPVLRAAGANCFSAGVTGDSEKRVVLTSSGHIKFGSGSATQDVMLKREDANTISVRNVADNAYKHFRADTGTFGSVSITTPLPASSGGTGIATAEPSKVIATDARAASGAAGSSTAVSARLLDPRDIPILKNDLRVTVTSGTPVTSSDATNTTVYVTPFGGNQVSIYNSTQSVWVTQTFSEASAALAATTNTNYDVFITSASNTTITVTLVAWSGDTTRATGLTLQDGRYVKADNSQALYVGTVRTNGTSATVPDTQAQRFCWNYFNREDRSLRAADLTDTWNYSTNTWRGANGLTSSSTPGTTNMFQFVLGVAEEPAYCQYSAMLTGSTVNTNEAGIALDSTTAPSAAQRVSVSGAGHAKSMAIDDIYRPSAGYHYVAGLEKTNAVGTTTWRGDDGEAFPYGKLTGKIRAHNNVIDLNTRRKLKRQELEQVA